MDKDKVLKYAKLAVFIQTGLIIILIIALLGKAFVMLID